MKDTLEQKPILKDVFVCLYLAFSYLSESLYWARYAMLLAVLAAVFVYLVQHGGRIKININFSLLFLPLILYCFASSLWADDPSLPIQKGVTIAEIWIVTAVIQLLYLDEPDARRMIRIFKWSGLLEAAVVIAVSGWSSVYALLINGSRLLSPELGNANTIGIVMSYTIVLCLDDIVSAERRRLLNLKILLPIIVLILSQSRTAIISSMIICVVLLVIQVSDRAKRKRAAVISAVIVAAILILIQKTTVLDTVIHRMTEMLGAVTSTKDADYSSVVRIKLVKKGVELWKAHPLFGVGIDNARLYTVRGYYCHNDFIELLADGGLIGIMFYFGVFAVLALKILRCRMPDRDLPKLGLVLMLLQLVLSFGSVHYYMKDVYFLVLIYYTIIRESEALSDTSPENRVISPLERMEN